MDLAALGSEVIKALRGECSAISERWGLTVNCRTTQLARFLWRCLEVYSRPEDIAAVLIGLRFVREWEGEECARVFAGELTDDEKKALYWYYHNAHPMCIPYAADIRRLKELAEFYVVEYF